MPTKAPKQGLVLLSLTQRLRSLGPTYTQKRVTRRLARAQKRLILLQKELRHQLLLTKELEQQQQQLQHRRLELTLQPSSLTPALLEQQAWNPPLQLPLQPGEPLLPLSQLEERFSRTPQ